MYLKFKFKNNNEKELKNMFKMWLLKYVALEYVALEYVLKHIFFI